MSKWALLKAALVSQRRDCDSSSSIHRFSGFQVLDRKRTTWQGFEITIAIDSTAHTVASIVAECLQYLETVDCTVCTARIVITNNETPYREALVNNLDSLNNVVQILEQSSHTIIARITHGDYVPSQPSFEYWSYMLPSGGTEHKALLTREVKRNSGLSVKGLLSNKLHGVDNTGNICVWPAEPLLLHTLLTVPRYREMVHGGRVLEIGGGTTALAGLGLAATGLCASVVVTDGHPDCVKNQVNCLTCVV